MHCRSFSKSFIIEICSCAHEWSVNLCKNEQLCGRNPLPCEINVGKLRTSLRQTDNTLIFDALAAAEIDINKLRAILSERCEGLDANVQVPVH